MTARQLYYCHGNVRAPTWDGYKGHLELYFGSINQTRIDRVTTAQVEKFIPKKRVDGMSLGNLRRILVTFNQVMKYAVRHGYISYNPVRDAERPKNQGRSKKSNITILNKPEINALHDLRHTYASLLIEQGENIKYIQVQLGHSSPTVTLDVYPLSCACRASRKARSRLAILLRAFSIRGLQCACCSKALKSSSTSHELSLAS